MRTNKRFNINFLFFFLCLFGKVNAQNFDEFRKGTFNRDNESLNYRILPPKDFDRDKMYPLIIFLHGSGERGTDNEMQLKHGGTFFISDLIRNKYPAFVVFPQCKPQMSWHNAIYDLSDPNTDYIFPEKRGDNLHLDLVEGLIDFIIKRYPIDKKKLYVGGLSMGGMGTFELVARNPNLFEAAFAICGGANPKIAKRLKKTRWWIFHGADDNVIPVWASRQIADALKREGADINLTIYPGVKHDSWTNTFKEPGLMNWLINDN